MTIADATTGADLTGPAQAAPFGAPRSRIGKRLSIVVPMHNEAPVLDELFRRLDLVIANCGLAVEIVCVDDGSKDATLALLRDHALRDPRVRVLALARNFGKEAALTAGVEAATGDVVAPLDADLQDPPELILEFLALWEQGYDVIYGVRADRSSDDWLKRTTARAFYRLFNRISDSPIPGDAGDFRLMDRQVVEALNRLPERNRFMKGLFAWVGFRQVGVPYSRPSRAAGVSSWGTLKLVRFAIDGLTAFSTAPLRVWTTVGLCAAFAAIIAAISIVIRVLVVGRDVPGYASTMIVVLFAFAIQMIAFGVLGEYVGRLYEEVKGRPIYLVREKIRIRRLMDRSVYDQMRAIEQDHWWFVARRRILKSQLDTLGLGGGSRILEVGCGTGGNLDMLTHYGRVFAIEPDDETRQYAASRTAARVLPGGLPDGLPDMGDPFDLVAALDVIEHVDQDAAAVAALAGKLKRGGRFLATVPAHPWMWSRHDEQHHHKRRYTRPSVVRLFRDAGLKICKASYFNSLLFPAIASVRLLQPLTGDSGRDDAMPSPRVNRLLQTVFAAEAPLLRKLDLPFGVSILVVAERP